MVYGLGLWLMVYGQGRTSSGSRSKTGSKGRVSFGKCAVHPKPQTLHIKEIRIWELYPTKLDDDREDCRGFDHAHLLDLDGVTVLVQTGGLLLHLQ